MISIENVSKSFGDVKAVAGLSIQIHTGEVYGLLGPNGAGKSTTISLMVGLLRPDSGRLGVQVGATSTDPSDPRVREKIGVATQALAMYDELTARENLEFFGRIYGMSGQACKSRAADLLAQVGLTERAGHRAQGFSGGMKRRLNLACSLMHDPALILLDEPTAGVDPQSRNSIFDIVRALKSAGKTVVYTTHYMEEAERLCDRVGIIDGGRLIAEGTVDHLIGAHGGMSTVVVERAGAEERVRTDRPLDVLQRVFADDGNAGANAMTAVRVDRPDLESVFLNLTGRSLRD